MIKKETLKMDLHDGIITIEGIRELLKMKKEGLKIDTIRWKPMIENYLYCKAETIEKLTQKLQQAQSDFLEAKKTKEELEHEKSDC
jgi:DNA-binding transcriptional MerR regulator